MSASAADLIQLGQELANVKTLIANHDKKLVEVITKIRSLGLDDEASVVEHTRAIHTASMHALEVVAKMAAS